MTDFTETASSAMILRKALEEIKDFADMMSDAFEHDGYAKIIELAKYALSKAPVRNCDRFKSGEKAWAAFEHENPDWCLEHASKDPGCDDCSQADCKICMAKWMLAPADPKKLEEAEDA